jgi:hypothetical protein
MNNNRLLASELNPLTETGGGRLATTIKIYYNFTSGDKIRVVHLVVGNSGSQMDPFDTFYLGVY